MYNKIIVTNHHRGFTMIELLVSILVLSIGLLGLAGLQAVSMKNNHSAYLRSQANLLAYDIIDRMRANRNSALANAYLVNFDVAPASATNCEGSTDCTEADMATFDLSQWKCSLGKWNSNSVCQGMGITGVLMTGDGQVTVAGSIFTVSIRYEERDGEQITLDVRSQL